MSDSLQDALLQLRTHGIAWAAFVPAMQGPEPTLCTFMGPDAGLLLLLSFGSRLTERALAAWPNHLHPVDSHSRTLAEAFCASALQEGSRLVYPGTERLDLRGWLKAARAQYPSPLGTGIRPDAGLWLAVRAAIVTRLDEPERRSLEALCPPLEPAGSPCGACAARDCASLCPAGAVGEVGAFDLDACTAHRLAEGSGCAARCPARLACPEGAAYRYAEAPLRYHYDVSLRTLRRWQAGQDGD